MDYIQLDNNVSLAMLEHALNDLAVKNILAEVAIKLRNNVLSIILQQEKSNLIPKLSSLAMQHSSGDKFIGALLPEYSQDYLEHTKEGRLLLLSTIDTCLKNAAEISTIHEFLALMKSIDGMAFMYDVFETDKKNSEHLKCKDYIAPTADETAIRCRRKPQTVALTYGIGTKIDMDLIENNNANKPPKGCLSGKALFFILPTENRNRVCFEKLADQKTINKPSLPLIASPSNAAAKNFIMANGLGLFKKDNDLFDLDKAQIFANCVMAYLVYCGHHSFLEVAEIWNRQLDYLAIEHRQQLPVESIKDINATNVPYMQNPDAIERKLPYAKIGDYVSFLHHSYADTVIQQMHNHITDNITFNFSL